MARVRTDTVRLKLGKLSQSAQAEVFKALYVAGDMVAAEAAVSITRGSISGKGHVPSLPGEPPNADTRQLDTNIHLEPDRPRMAIRVVSNAPYSEFLEYGTSKMAARPFLRRALLEKAPESVDLIKRAIAKATKS